MDIGICINMYPSPNGPEQIGMENIHLYRDAGFDHIELPGGALMNRPPDERRRLEDEILACGVPARAISSLVHPSLRLTGPNTDMKAIDEYIEGVCAMAERLGVKMLVFGSSGARNVPMHFPYEKAWEQLVRFLRRLGDRAKAGDIMVTVEHINRLEGNIVLTFREGVLMVEQTDHPNVRCLIDNFHLGLGNESMDLLSEKIDLVKHAHYSNVLQRSVPHEDRHEEQGVRYLELLKRKGYGGLVSVEGFTSDPADFARCAEFVRRFK